MSARRSFPIGILIMIMMMALAVLGVGYAWWTEELSASAAVQTGSIDVRMGNPLVAEVDPLDVAECTPGFSEDGKALAIAIENAYPSYVCKISFELTNHGTVPAKIAGVSLPLVNDDLGVLPLNALVSRPMLNPAAPVQADVLIRVRPEAAQNVSATFDFSIDIVQGNAP